MTSETSRISEKSDSILSRLQADIFSDRFGDGEDGNSPPRNKSNKAKSFCVRTPTHNIYFVARRDSEVDPTSEVPYITWP